MKFPVAKNLFAFVSNEDNDLIYLHNWVINDEKYPYPCATIKGKKVFLHMIIANRIELKGPEIDHKDRNPLNCQRDNLRSATRSQNQMNAKGKSNKRSILPKGIDLFRNKYRARIWVNGTRYFLGYFDTEMEADKAYKEAVKFYHGKFAFKENKNATRSINTLTMGRCC